MDITDDVAQEGYRIDKPIGQGGMACVFLAEDPSGHTCVIKTPLEAGQKKTLSRFFDEAKLGMLVSHRALAQTFDFFVVRDRPFLVMEHIQGCTLAELIVQMGPLSPRLVAEAMFDIFDAAQCLHSAVSSDGLPLNAVHRDISTKNIIVDGTGAAKLIDLGICRFSSRVTQRTETGGVCGTARYVAPEIWHGGAFSAASDIWSIGMCALEALLGRPATPGGMESVIHGIGSGGYLDAIAEVPCAHWRRFLYDVLAPAPEQRPRSAGVAAVALRNILADVSHHDPAPRPKPEPNDDVNADDTQVDMKSFVFEASAPSEELSDASRLLRDYVGDLRTLETPFSLREKKAQNG